MRFTASLIATALLTSTAIAGPIDARDHHKSNDHYVDSHDMDDSYNIFKNADKR
jgi:hypothetical protein